jgi:hexosaminidase
MKPFCPFLLLLPLLLTALPAEEIGPLWVPLPNNVSVGKEVLALPENASIRATVRELEPLARVLADEIMFVTGVRLATASDPGTAGDVVLRMDPSMKGEAYTLDVAGSAVVTGATYQSVASGTVTLLQALQSGNGGLSLPKMTVTDEPACSYRGALIDPGRKYHSPGGIEQVINLCRMYKIRYLQLHLTDDQLFMFPSTAFPQAGKSNREFARFEPASMPYVAPYTLDELRGLERYARERGVHLVPELDLPGHSGRLIADVPEIFGMPGNASTVNIASPKTFAAISVLMNEVMDVFQSTPYIHLGADEVGLGGLEKTPEYKELQAKIGLKSAHDLYCKFIVDLHALVTKRGKQSIVWEEAWNPDGNYPLPKDAIVMSWTHGRNPADMVERGYQVINASWTPLYIVRNDKRSMEFLSDWQVSMFGRGHRDDDRYTTLAATDLILGAQMCSWENAESIEIQSLRDRLALVAERCWNPQAGGTLASFKARLAHSDAILEKMVHPITIHAEGSFIEDENTFTGPLAVTLTPKRPGHTLKYTLDNSMPNEKWRIYDGPIAVTGTVHLRAGLFDQKGIQQGHLVGAWFRNRVVVKPNLATGKPVTVGPAPDRDDNWSAKVAVDGRADNANAHWASAEAAPQWLQVDLGKIQPIDFINLITYWDGSRYYQWTAEVSEDEEHWKKVLDFSRDTVPATAAGYPCKFPKTMARHVRINMLKNSANPYAHIVELIVDEQK